MNMSPDHQWNNLIAKADLQLLLHKVPMSLTDFKDATVSLLSPL